MKWLLPVLVLCAAGGALWYLLGDDQDVGYGPGEARGGAVSSDPERDGVMRAKGSERLGVYGQSPLPSEPMRQDGWMESPLTWPRGGGAITGKVLAEALADAVPVRFINQSEMDAFMGHEFMSEVPEGEGDIGMIGGMLEGSGYVMEIRERFVLLRALRKEELPTEEDG